MFLSQEKSKLLINVSIDLSRSIYDSIDALDGKLAYFDLIRLLQVLKERWFGLRGAKKSLYSSLPALSVKVYKP